MGLGFGVRVRIRVTVKLHPVEHEADRKELQHVAYEAWQQVGILLEQAHRAEHRREFTSRVCQRAADEGGDDAAHPPAVMGENVRAWVGAKTGVR